jgi:hypothetical protein
MPRNTAALTVKGPRIEREMRTVTAMMHLYCREQHHTDDGLCAECTTVQEYAMRRLERCPFQEGKTTCAKCTVHCYKPDMRERIRVVMRYSGPRMLWQHPLLAVQHLMDGRRSEAVLPVKPVSRP